MPPPPPPATSSPSSSRSTATTPSAAAAAAAGGEQQGPSWWESVSQARARILALAAILPPCASPGDVAALADSDRPALALLHSPAAYAAVSASLSSGGGADDPTCHWLYDTLLSPDPDLRLAALAFLPLLSSLYLLRLPLFPSSLSGFEAVLLAVYSSESKNRQGKPLLVHLPDLSLPSLYHSPTSTPRSSPRRPPHAAAAPPAVGVLSPPLEPQVAVKSTKRAGIVGVALEAYYAKVALMPAASKVDACRAAAAWAGQYCACRFELDDGDVGGAVSSLGSLSPVSSSSSSSALEEEVARLRIGGDGGGANGRHCEGEVEEEERRMEARVTLPWELLQPVLRVLGHCLLAPLNTKEVRDAASVAVRVVYARACHELVPQAILAARSLVLLDKSARKAAKAATAGAVAAVGSTGSSSKPNTPSKQKKPEVLLASK